MYYKKKKVISLYYKGKYAVHKICEIKYFQLFIRKSVELK